MASAVDALAKTVAQDLGKAGMLSLPITLVILVTAFGALVAAAPVAARPDGRLRDLRRRRRDSPTSSRWQTRPARSCS